MDECGNALLVYEQDYESNTCNSSLMSKAFAPGKGWDESATVIEPLFNADKCLSTSPRRRADVSTFATHGGGNATLITDASWEVPDYNVPGLPPDSPVFLWEGATYVRQYRAGRGWDSAQSTLTGWVPYSRSVPRSQHSDVIDRYGNFTGIAMGDVTLSGGQLTSEWGLLRFE